jgi:predicted transcriptional regulator
MVSGSTGYVNAAKAAPDNRKRQHLVGVRLDDAELARLDRLAERHKTTRSELLRLALLSAALTDDIQEAMA